MIDLRTVGTVKKKKKTIFLAWLSDFGPVSLPGDDRIIAAAVFLLFGLICRIRMGLSTLQCLRWGLVVVGGVRRMRRPRRVYPIR